MGRSIEALPEPQSVETKSYIAPQTPTEEVLPKSGLMSYAANVLEPTKFSTGGHSLLATQVVSRCGNILRLSCDSALFDATIGSLAIATADKTAHRSQEPAIVQWPASSIGQQDLNIKFTI
jgi:hypothetical protein